MKNCTENYFQVHVSEPKWLELSDVTGSHGLLFSSPGAAERSVGVWK